MSTLAAIISTRFSKTPGCSYTLEDISYGTYVQIRREEGLTPQKCFDLLPEGVVCDVYIVPDKR